MDPLNISSGAMYTRTQRYILQTHGVPAEEPTSSTGRENPREVTAANTINGAAMYTRTQRYTLQTHRLMDEEPVPSTSGEDRQKAGEVEEEQNVDAERRKKRMPEKRTSGTQSNESFTDPNYGKKQKKAPNSSTDAQHTIRSGEDSPNVLYVTATGTASSEDANPRPDQREPVRTAPVAASSSGWRRPYAESAGVGAPAEHGRGVLQQATTSCGTRSSGLNLALADCLDSLTGLDPDALYKVEFVPPVPARLTLTRVESPPLPPPPLLFPYGVAEGSLRTYGDSRQPDVADLVRPAAPDVESRSGGRQPSGTAADPPTTRKSLHGTPRIWEHLPATVKHVKDAQTITCCSKQSQTDFVDGSTCCPLISANRVLLHHNTPKNRGQTTVLEVDHLLPNVCGPSNFSTPNPVGNPKTSDPPVSARLLGQVRPPESGFPNEQRAGPVLRKTPSTLRADVSRERNSSTSDTLRTSSGSLLSSWGTTYSSYVNTPDLK